MLEQTLDLQVKLSEIWYKLPKHTRENENVCLQKKMAFFYFFFSTNLIICVYKAEFRVITQQ